MIYELCYELIKSVVLLIVLHYLFLYLKNLFIEVYEFNPLEISLNKYIKPTTTDSNISSVSTEQPIINNTKSSIDSADNVDDIINDNNIKEELINFINNDFNSVDDNNAYVFNEQNTN